MVIAEGAQAFEMLPLERDAGILRNILYSGVWSRYGAMHNPQKNEKKPTRAQKFRQMAMRPVQAVRRRANRTKRRTKS